MHCKVIIEPESLAIRSLQTADGVIYFKDDLSAESRYRQRIFVVLKNDIPLLLLVLIVVTRFIYTFTYLRGFRFLRLSLSPAMRVFAYTLTEYLIDTPVSEIV